MQNLIPYFLERQNDYTEILESLVKYESPSDNKNASNKVINYLEHLLVNLGGSVERSTNYKFADNLVARWGNGEGRILLIGHADTVWPVGEERIRPFKIENGLAWGPGAHDMKGSLAMALCVLKAIQHFGIKRPISFIVNADEEVGSPTSRAIIERESRISIATLVLEPPGSNGELKTSRSGVGFFQMELTSNPDIKSLDGRVIINELLCLIDSLAIMNDFKNRTFVNVGVIRGGTNPGLVPRSISLEVDLRVCNKEIANRMEDSILKMKPRNPCLSLRITGGINRPPMERTDGNINLFKLAKQIADQLGFSVKEIHAGGASDGNFTSNIGIPTLDGLGVNGSGGHSINEYVDVTKFPERAALLFNLLANL